MHRDFPYQIGINTEVIVHDAMSEPNDLRPRNFGEGRAVGFGELAGGFADDF